MKKVLIITCLATMSLVLSAQDSRMRTLWADKGSPEEKVIALKKVKAGKLTSIPDRLAYQAIASVGQKNQDGLLVGIRNLEAFTPTMRKTVDTLYPGLINWYGKAAADKNLFQFTGEINPPITLREVEEEHSDPLQSLETIRFLTLEIQKELIESNNMIIGKDWERITNIYSSLTESQKQQLADAGYPEFWAQQQECYHHKYQNRSWDCACGQKEQEFSTLTACSPKVLTLNDKAPRLDAGTLVLMRLTQGDLSALATANELKLTSYSEAKNSLVGELVWLHSVSVNRPTLNSSMSINLVDMWDAAEAAGNNDYNKNIGLDRETVLGLQQYYQCILGVKTITPKVIKNPVVSSDSQSLATPQPSVIRSSNSETATKSLHAQAAQAKVITTLSTQKANGLMDLEKIAPELQAELQESLDLHDGLSGCVEVVPVNKTTLEIKVTGCGIASKGIFRIMETENPVTEDFYNVCGNLVFKNVIEPFQKKFGGDLNLTIIGTADTLTCVTCDNYVLAKNRANGVVKHLGPKLLTAATSNNRKVNLLAVTEELERKVVIRIELVYPQK